MRLTDPQCERIADELADLAIRRIEGYVSAQFTDQAFHDVHTVLTGWFLSGLGSVTVPESLDENGQMAA